MTKKLFLGLFIFLWMVFPSGSFAQEGQAEEGPVYIVQEGDTLWIIALQFGVSIDALMTVNNITNANQVGIGTRLVVPGYEGMGINGVIKTIAINYGEDIRSLSRKTGVPVEMLERLNRLVLPSEIYVGMPLIVVENEAGLLPGGRPILEPGQSTLELSAMRGVNPWSFTAPQSTSIHAIIPGEVLWLPLPGNQTSDSPAPGALPDSIDKIVITPLPTVQGQMVQLEVTGQPGITLGGEFTGRNLSFFPDNTEAPEGRSNYVALQGIHALQQPGFYSMVISGTLQTGANFAFSQAVYVRDGDYVFDPTLIVKPETIDPVVTKPEDAQWSALTSVVTPEKYWDGKFIAPVPPEFAKCYPSRYGSRRSYNDGPYNYFHTGLDFCGNENTDVLAPAAGVVVFAGPLTVRGNATVIDHGQGVYSGLLHQSQIFVKPGDVVTAGQVIGRVGATGRVTGPHLHWEVWVGGVQVEPETWLSN